MLIRYMATILHEKGNPQYKKIDFILESLSIALSSAITSYIALSIYIIFERPYIIKYNTETYIYISLSIPFLYIASSIMYNTSVFRRRDALLLDREISPSTLYKITHFINFTALSIFAVVTLFTKVEIPTALLVFIAICIDIAFIKFGDLFSSTTYLRRQVLKYEEVSLTKSQITVNCSLIMGYRSSYLRGYRKGGIIEAMFDKIFEGEIDMFSFLKGIDYAEKSYGKNTDE